MLKAEAGAGTMRDMRQYKAEVRRWELNGTGGWV
jgi:hypothetical protein